MMSRLVDKVDAEEVQYQTSQDEVCKGSLIADTVEVALLVLWIRLYS